MRCREALKNLSAHLDGELDAAKSERIDAHLGECSSCQAQAAAYARLDGALADALVSPEPSASFDAGFAAKLEAARLDKARATQAPTKRRWSWPLLAALASAAAVAALVIVLASTDRDDSALPARDLLASAQPVSDLALAQNLGLLRNYRLVKDLDALEDFEAIKELDRLQGAQP